MARYQMQTRDHPMDEAVSALQKTIRRCDVESAVYFAVELNERYPWYVWRRLCIIAAEDIGLANLPLVMQVHNTAASILAGKNKEYPVSILARTVAEMANSPKTRETDDVFHHVGRGIRLGTYRNVRGDELMSYEDMFARLLECLMTGEEEHAVFWAMKMNRGYIRWLWRDLATLAYDVLADPVQVSAVQILSDHFFACWKDDGKGYEKCYLGLAILLMARAEKDTSLSSLGGIVYSNWKLGKVQAVPDYAKDVHTRAGRSLGRTVAHFFSEHGGSRVENLAWPNKYEAFTFDGGCGGALGDLTPAPDQDWCLADASLESKDGAAKINEPAKPVHNQGGLFG